MPPYPSTLHEAIESGDVEAVRAFVNNGWAVNDPNLSAADQVFGQRAVSPINLAIALGHLGILKVLIEAGVGLNHGDPLPPVMTALSHRNLDALKALREAGAWLEEAHLGEHGGTLLHMAAGLGDEIMVRWLVEQGLDLEARDQMGHAPLAKALAEDIDPGHKRVAMALLALGADPNRNGPKSIGRRMDNPLGRVVRCGDAELARALIAAGARVSEAFVPHGGSNNASSLLAIALQRQDGAGGIVKALIEAGDDLTVKGHIYFVGGGYYEHGNLPLAVRPGDDLIDLLALAAAQTKVDDTKALLEAGMSIDTLSQQGRTALLVMLERANETVSPEQRKTVQLLLDAGVDPDVKGPEGNTALHLLARRYNRMPHSEKSTMKMLAAVLDAGADPWITNDLGMTALETMLTAASEVSPGPLLLTATMESARMQQNTPSAHGRKRERRL